MSIEPSKLQEHTFLKGMPEQHVSTMIEGAEEKVFSAGEIIFREGEPANRLFLVHEGKVALETREPQKRDVLVAELGAGEVLGWSWLVPPYVWHFQARATEQTRATVLNGAHLLVASERNHSLGCELMKRISQVILEVLLAAQKRLLESGFRPAISSAQKSPAEPVNLNQSLEARMAEHPFFHGMRPGQIKALAEYATHTEYQAGEVVFTTGAPANRFYLIERGQIVLEAPRPGGPVPLQALGAGDSLGWSCFFEPYQWHFDARAVEPTSTICCYGTWLRERCAQDPHLGYEFMKRVNRIVLQRLQATRKSICLAKN
jgi:CRP/FNR family transcriptional regulator, cyclic AMP receptor protein